jgi:hypothetical protein
MSGFTLLGRLCVCPHGHGSWCNCVPSAGPAHGLSRAGAVCVRGQCGRQMIHLTKTTELSDLHAPRFNRDTGTCIMKTLAIDDVPNFRLAALSPQ